MRVGVPARSRKRVTTARLSKPWRNSLSFNRSGVPRVVGCGSKFVKPGLTRIGEPVPGEARQVAEHGGRGEHRQHPRLYVEQLVSDDADEAALQHGERHRHRQLGDLFAFQAPAGGGGEFGRAEQAAEDGHEGNVSQSRNQGNNINSSFQAAEKHLSLLCYRISLIQRN